MTRFASFLALLLLAPAALAQGAPPPEGEACRYCAPPVLHGDLSGEVQAVELVAENMRDMADDDPGYAFIWWLAHVTGGHIPVDPNCPPPDGCTTPPADDPPANDPPGDDPPADDPPADDPPAGGPVPTNPDPGQPGPPTMTSEYSAGSTVETYHVGDRRSATALYERIRGLETGAVVPGVQLAMPARVLLTSFRSSSATTYAATVAVETRDRTVPVTVQAGDGVLIARVAVQSRSSASGPRGGRRAGAGPGARGAAPAQGVTAPAQRDGAPEGRRERTRPAGDAREGSRRDGARRDSAAGDADGRGDRTSDDGSQGDEAGDGTRRDGADRRDGTRRDGEAGRRGDATSGRRDGARQRPGR